MEYNPIVFLREYYRKAVDLVRNYIPRGQLETVMEPVDSSLLGLRACLAKERRLNDERAAFPSMYSR